MLLVCNATLQCVCHSFIFVRPWPYASLNMSLAFMDTGHSVNDDIMIIIGATKADESPSKEILEVQEAIIKLLWNELGLEALPAKTGFAPNDRTKSQSPKLANLTLKVPTRGFPTRRPAVLQRLKVTKKSLHGWLQRKVSVQ